MIGSVEDVRFDLTGYDDAVESWEEEVNRLLLEGGPDKGTEDNTQEVQDDSETE